MKMIVAKSLTLALEETMVDGRIPQHWRIKKLFITDFLKESQE